MIHARFLHERWTTNILTSPVDYLSRRRGFSIPPVRRGWGQGGRWWVPGLSSFNKTLALSSFFTITVNNDWTNSDDGCWWWWLTVESDGSGSLCMRPTKTLSLLLPTREVMQENSTCSNRCGIKSDSFIHTILSSSLFVSCYVISWHIHALPCPTSTHPSSDTPSPSNRKLGMSCPCKKWWLLESASYCE